MEKGKSAAGIRIEKLFNQASLHAVGFPEVIGIVLLGMIRCLTADAFSLFGSDGDPGVVRLE